MTATTTYALVTGITLSSITDPPILGNGYMLYPDDTGPEGVSSYNWAVTRAFPKYTMPKTGIGTTYGAVGYAEVPATYNDELTTTYTPNFATFPPTTPAPTVHTKSVTIAPADSFRRVSGFYTPVPINSSITLVYHPKAGSNLCGPVVAGTAQELLTDRKELGVKKDDWGWYSLAASDMFRLSGGKIYDEHVRWAAPAIWDATPIGTVLASATQHLRIMYSDFDGNLYEMDLGSIRIRHVKVSATQWQIETF